jgi:hypothetical protein
MKKRKTPKRTWGVVTLNPFDLPGFPAVGKAGLQAEREATYALAKALIRKS